MRGILGYSFLNKRNINKFPIKKILKTLKRRGPDSAKDIKIICTIGPSTFQKKRLNQLIKLNVNLFRINLSHTKIGDLPKRIKTLQNLKINNICIDTEGSQVRTTILPKKFLKINQIIIFNRKKKK